MSARLELVHLALDSLSPKSAATWWSQALGWPRDVDAWGLEGVHPPPGQPGVAVRFLASDQPKARRNRLHLHLGCAGLSARRAMADRLISSGGRRADVGQGRSAKLVLRDPDGNEFCLAEPLQGYENTGVVSEIIVPARNPDDLATFWAAALGYERARAVNENGDPVTGLRRPDQTGPALTVVRSEEAPPRLGRTRMALGSNADLPHTVEHLVSLGAKKRNDEPENHAVVLHDPEGTAFCLLRPPDSIPG